MVNKLKYFIITITLVLIVLPFVLLTDIFPFLRFGMFAEPVRLETQKEKFVVTSLLNGREKEFDPKEAGIGDNTFYYLARNYYYREEANGFLEKTSQVGNCALRGLLSSVKFDRSSDLVLGISLCSVL